MKLSTAIRLSRKLSLLAGAFICGTMLWAQSVTHTVQAGETLYSISRKYGLTVDELLRKNPGVTAETLQAGALLNVQSATKQGGIANSDCREMHKVKKGETIYGISKLYGITEEMLKEANPALKDPDYTLKKGMFLCIPFGAAPTATTPAASASQKQEVKVSILLPLKEQNEAGARCVEFYRGFITAAEKLADEGYDLTLNAVNEGESHATIESELAIIAQQKPDFIVGPLYPSHFEALSAFAKEKGIRVIVPFSSRMVQVEKNPYLFLVNAPETYKAMYACQLLKKAFNSPQLIFINSSTSGNSAFLHELKAQAEAQKIAATSFTKSSILLEWKTQLKANRKNLFITDANSANELQQVAQTVAQLKKANPSYDISLITSADALQYTAVVEPAFFTADTYILTHTFFNTYANASQQFAAAYKQKYNTSLLPLSPSLAALGYDLGYQTMKQYAHYGKKYTTQILKTTPYQSEIRFLPTTTEGGFVNGSMLFIHYKLDGTIDRISL